MMPFVLDNSVVTAWYFENQATAYSDGVLQLMGGEIAPLAAGIVERAAQVHQRKKISLNPVRERSSRKTSAGRFWSIRLAPGPATS